MNLSLTTKIFRRLICIIAYIIWAPIGLVVWLPVLVLEVALFCGALMNSMLTNNDQAFANRKIKLDKVIILYTSGFENIKNVDNRHISSSDNNLQIPYTGIFIGRIVWSFLFWFLFLIIINL